MHVAAHRSVLATLVLFTELLATATFPSVRHGHSSAAYWLVAGMTSVAFFVTLLVHELAHAVVARHYGIRVKQVTLWMFGGVTELEGDAPSPKADAAIAVAGPAASLVIGAACIALTWGIGSGGLFGVAISWLGAISVVLGVFNLLPGAPLDGGRVLRALLWWHSHDQARAANQAARAGRGLGVLLAALGLMELFAGSFAGLWLAFIGWFILTSATSERDAAQFGNLHGLSASDVMATNLLVANGWWTVEHFLSTFQPDELTQPVFPVVDFAGQVTGAVHLSELTSAPDQEARIRDIGGSRRLPTLVVRPDDPVDVIAARRRHSDGEAIVIDAEGHPIGLIGQAELARAARIATERAAGAAPTQTP